MAIRPSTPEIITVNSEDLQTQIRDLLPSQDGFGSELQASNVITPIIDLTAAAEGSGLPQYLQEAISFGSQTAFNVQNTSATLANSPGFYRIVGTMTFGTSSGTPDTSLLFNMTDGSTTKAIYGMVMADYVNNVLSESYDFIVFLRAGDSIDVVSNDGEVTASGSVRQIATGDGTLVQPNGYPL